VRVPGSSVLAVGMLPPPVGGQAVMFEVAIASLRTEYQVDVIDLQVQRNIGSSGKFNAFKIVAFLRILLRSLKVLLGPKIYDVLYYCPSGPSVLGSVKDAILLILLRRCARKTVFHFHATGGSSYLKLKLPLIANLVLMPTLRPDLSIRCAEVYPNDAEICDSRKSVIIYNGVRDIREEAQDMIGAGKGPLPILLFMGAMTYDKGIFDLLQIAAELKARSRKFHVKVAGQGTADELNSFCELRRELNVVDEVEYIGVVSGREKAELLASAMVFVFPTFFRAETQPLVLIESLAVGVPVVASNWRGIRSIVDEGGCGFTPDVHAIEIFCDRIEEIVWSKDYIKFCLAARQRYEQLFRLETFASGVGKAIREII